jgi:deoxyadenosine/deoxycytidine kinase
MQQPQPILITIEGDIGAGKSTLIDKLRTAHPDWHFIDEPVSTWVQLQTAEGKNLLELFYDDKTRYSYTFQNCALLSRALNIKTTIDDWQKRCRLNPEEETKNVFITERCIETDYNVFAKMLHDDGHLNLMEWDLYKMWYSFVKDQSYALSGIVYVNTPPEICQSRIHIRGRKGEDSIPLEYLQNLEKYQNEWLYGDDMLTRIMTYKNYGKEQNTAEDVEVFVDSLSSMV